MLRVLTGAIVLLGASLFLNISGDTGSFEALLAMAPQAKQKCITIGEKRVCFEDGAKKKNDDDDDDDDEPKSKKATKDCRKARCEPGLVVLDKPNKYGACCEAREGLPPPKTAEPEKCKFPGEVGTPPIALVLLERSSWATRAALPSVRFAAPRLGKAVSP
jgi:hypothetical protein